MKSEFCMEIIMVVMKLILALLPIMPAAAAASASVLNQHSGDTMVPNKTITDGETLISSGGKFEMGFFSPGESTNRYLGIWFHNISLQTVVWVANRAQPLSSSDAGTLHLSPDGNLLLSNKHGRAFWSTGTSTKGTNPALRLLDSGSLVLISDVEGSGGQSVVWQSFDHPSDTYLSGMKVGVDYQHNISWQFTSWRSPSDPAPGEYCYKYSSYDVPQTHIWKGSQKIARFYGPWDWPKFIGSNNIFSIEFVRNAYGGYYSTKQVDTTQTGRVLLNTTGSLQLSLWTPSSQEWTTYVELPSDICDNYAICGANGVCDPSYSSICRCLQGFVPRSPGNWSTGKYSEGCVREAADLKCSSSDSFALLHNMKVPDTENATSDVHMNLNECKNWCMRNCSCTAYAVLGVTGCVIWHGDVYDIKVNSALGNDLYVRLPLSELGSTKLDFANKKHVLVITVACALGSLLIFLGLILFIRRRTRKNQAIKTYAINAGEGEEHVELTLYDMLTMQRATDEFSTHNILGKGGFGIVYKGKLEDGQEIAVKRLSKKSTQGLNEFKTEVNLIAKLQHRNLVQLLGYCVEDEERMLLYEYMQNGSLDAFLLERRNNALLTWERCFDIIRGIARGLLYLHQDSRLKVIHRDLKTSNILLDKDLNPKISDFGMARILKLGQSGEQTRRVVGTYGYMAPEYAMDGFFSEKSDVFSFGVIVLKILLAKRKRSIAQDAPTNILEHVWELWQKGKGLEFLEGAIELSSNSDQILKCVQIGLLCVQEKSEDRPTMTDIALMLDNESIMVPLPKQPGFCNYSIAIPESPNAFTSNEVTITILEGR